jgi:hypothetical protein
MLMLLPIIVALAAGEPTPGPTTAPRPTPLTEIGRVRALPACVPIVAHANGAITHALENDRTLAVITTNLRNTNYDKLNSLQRRNAIDALMKQAEAVRIASSAGDAEVKKLREYAANSADPKRKEELKTFADALGGALYRQKKAAVEFMRDISIMRGREDATEVREIMKTANPAPPLVPTPSVSVRQTANVLPDAPTTYNRQLQYIGDVLEGLTAGIQTDEGLAADHSIAATSGC